MGLAEPTGIAMRFFEPEETGRIRGNPTALFAGAIPSRAVGGPAEGVETRRARHIGRGNTPQASGRPKRAEEIVRAGSNAGKRRTLAKNMGLDWANLLVLRWLSYAGGAIATFLTPRRSC